MSPKHASSQMLPRRSHNRTHNVSQEFACGHIIATDFERGDVVVESKSGQTKPFPFDVATVTIRD